MIENFTAFFLIKSMQIFIMTKIMFLVILQWRKQWIDKKTASLKKIENTKYLS